MNRLDRQKRILDWVFQTFGPDLCSTEERTLRFLEEAIELAQACKLPQRSVQDLVKYVYSRPVGQLEQEAGGVGLSLLALCEKIGIDADAEEERELDRVLSLDPQHFRDRQNAKAEQGVASPTSDYKGSGKRVRFPAWPFIFTLVCFWAAVIAYVVFGAERASVATPGVMPSVAPSVASQSTPLVEKFEIARDDDKQRVDEFSVLNGGLMICARQHGTAHVGTDLRLTCIPESGYSMWVLHTKDAVKSGVENSIELFKDAGIPDAGVP